MGDSEVVVVKAEAVGEARIRLKTQVKVIMQRPGDEVVTIAEVAGTQALALGALQGRRNHVAGGVAVGAAALSIWSLKRMRRTSIIALLKARMSNMTLHRMILHRAHP